MGFKGIPPVTSIRRVTTFSYLSFRRPRASIVHKQLHSQTHMQTQINIITNKINLKILNKNKHTLFLFSSN